MKFVRTLLLLNEVLPHLKAVNKIFQHNLDRHVGETAPALEASSTFRSHGIAKNNCSRVPGIWTGKCQNCGTKVQIK